MLRSLWYGILDLFLPVRCIICGDLVETEKFSLPLCGQHRAGLPRLHSPQCDLCGRPLYTGELAPPETEDPSPACGSCRSKKLYQQFTLAPFAYHGSLKKIIVDWKFSGREEWGKFLGSLLAAEVSRRLAVENWDAVTPVPLHQDKLKERGFNQAAQLAESIAKEIDVNYEELLCKHRKTGAQSELKREERLANLNDAFEPATEKIGQKSILLVDDIYTTGSTLRSASKTLLDAGAGRIGAIVLARSLPERIEENLYKNQVQK
jgi:ComF family protein